MKNKLLFCLLCLTLLLSLAVSVSAAAGTAAAETADFAADPAAALALLRAAKTEGAADPTWDAWTKTLTLRGVDFATTARCAVVLPAGSTLMLADGTENFITGGSMVTGERGEKGFEYIYVYGLYTAGDLTVRGGGSLTVHAGSFKNTGKSPNSIGLFVGGNLTVRNGSLTAMGGDAYFVEANTDGWAFSIGIEVTGGDVLITGGCLRGIGGFSMECDDIGVFGSFSRGFMALETDVTVSGDGKLYGEVKPAARNNGLKNGIYIIGGRLSVADTAEVIGEANVGINITGAISLSGGTLSGIGTGVGSTYGINLDGTGSNKWTGNVTMTGGTLTVDGSVYMYAPTEKNKAVFRMTGGTAALGTLYGAQQLLLEGGSLTVGSDTEPGSVNATAAVLSGGSMDIVAEAWTDAEGYPRGFALSCATLEMRGGQLSARYKAAKTPLQLPASLALVQAMESADFMGGTTRLDAGCGNTAVLSIASRYTTGGGVSYTDGIIRMQGGGMHLTGSRETLSESGAVRLTQKYQGSPVTFSDVVRRPVTVTLAAQSKRYDGSTDCALIGTFSGVDAGDTLRLGTVDAEVRFDTPDVGTDKPVTVKGTLEAIGAHAYKYTLEQPGTALLRASIYKAEAPTLTPVTRWIGPEVTTAQTVSLPVMPADAGALAYTAGVPQISGAVQIGSFSAADGVLTYTLADGALGDVIRFPVTVQSGNYEDAVCTVTVRLVDFIPGDLNRDGKVSKVDLLLLQKVLAGWDVECNRDAADTSGDGKLNKADLLLLQKKLAGWDVCFGG